MFSFLSKFEEQNINTWKRQQLFHATDFQSLMCPNSIFCRIFGIFPYKINASTIEISKMGKILGNFIFGVFCIYEIIILHEIIVTKIVNYKDVTHMLQCISYYTLGGFMVIITYISSGPRIRVLQTILNTSSRLSPESYRKLSRWIHIKDILGTCFLVINIIIYYYKLPEYISYYVLTAYLDLVIFQMDMLYMNCICVLKTCFQSVNDNLVHLQNVVINDVLYGARLICDTQNNQSLLIKLKTLKKQHLIASDTMRMLNVIFSLQLLVTVARTFIDVTFEMYFNLIQWQDGLFFTFYDDFSETYFSIYVGYLVLKLILIVWACESSKNQALQIGTTVHDVLNCTSDKQIKEELHLFSLQVLHCARNTFNMKGLNMDATLLAAMTGSIATYMLILIQFMILSHSCDRKTTNITQIIYLERDT